MTTPVGCAALKGALHRQRAHLPAQRHKGPNTPYAIRDTALGAFGLFFTQSPSFLACQRWPQHAKGQTNVHTLRPQPCIATPQLSHPPAQPWPTALLAHAALPPLIVGSGQSQVSALPPADSRPQDGPATTDCERTAGNRWLSQHVARIAMSQPSPGSGT
jgi:hypothetical protein